MKMALAFPTMVVVATLAMIIRSNFEGRGGFVRSESRELLLYWQ